MVNPEITKRIRAFKRDLRKNTPDQIVTKYLTTGYCYIFDDEIISELKTEVANFLKVHPNDVIIVGSAKLGFSLVKKRRTIDADKQRFGPERRYQHFNIEDSDIDIAVCNANKFDECWDIAHQYKGDWPKRNSFIKYLYDGWIRPDKLPPATDLKNSWFEFFKEDLSTRERFNKNDINCGLYKNWSFLERYQLKAVHDCKQEDLLLRRRT